MTFALWTFTLSTKPSVSTSKWRFLPLTFLPPIVATFFSTHAARLYRLAIDDARAGLRVSLEAHPHPLAQGCVYSGPCSVQAKLSEVVVDATLRWEIMRKQAPGTAAPYNIEDSVKDLA